MVNCTTISSTTVPQIYHPVLTPRIKSMLDSVVVWVLLCCRSFSKEMWLFFCWIKAVNSTFIAAAFCVHVYFLSFVFISSRVYICFRTSSVSFFLSGFISLVRRSGPFVLSAELRLCLESYDLRASIAKRWHNLDASSFDDMSFLPSHHLHHLPCFSTTRQLLQQGGRRSRT